MLLENSKGPELVAQVGFEYDIYKEQTTTKNIKLVAAGQASNALPWMLTYSSGVPVHFAELGAFIL